MDNELMRHVTGQELAPHRDRAVARKAKRVYDEVRLRALQADGALALGAHIMEGVVGFDDLRRELSSGDPITNALLMEVEAETVRQVKSTQRKLGDSWDL